MRQGNNEEKEKVIDEIVILFHDSICKHFAVSLEPGNLVSTPPPATKMTGVVVVAIVVD